MKVIEPPDSHHLRSAEGWLELGNPQESLIDLERITPSNQNHPDVLAVRWHIFEKLKNWEQCVLIAHQMMEISPENPRGFIDHANALFFWGRTEEAYQSGKIAMKKFPKNAVLPYNMACYACRLGDLDECWGFLEKACKLGNKEEIKNWARRDPDLAILREIRSIENL